MGTPTKAYEQPSAITHRIHFIYWCSIRGILDTIFSLIMLSCIGVIYMLAMYAAFLATDHDIACRLIKLVLSLDLGFEIVALLNQLLIQLLSLLCNFDFFHFASLNKNILSFCILLPSLAFHCANINSVFGVSPNINLKKLWDENK